MITGPLPVVRELLLQGLTERGPVHLTVLFERAVRNPRVTQAPRTTPSQQVAQDISQVPA